MSRWGRWRCAWLLIELIQEISEKFDLSLSLSQPQAHKCNISMATISIFNYFYFIREPAELPPKQMLTAAKAFISQSLESGVLKSDYKLLGHRQVRLTECPGQRLFEEISNWEHYSSKPAGPNDPKIPN